MKHASIQNNWSPTSWQSFEASQQPVYRDSEMLESVLSELGQLPPIVTSWEVESLKKELAKAHPYQTWLNKTQIVIEDLVTNTKAVAPDHQTILDRQQAFGYTQEDIKFFLQPMTVSAQDPVGSMGRDIPPVSYTNLTLPTRDLV